tara:strand:+ start:61 stop:1182 length:1122 start_codon:yes stop_codon:yes gene_type:complete
MSPQHDYIIDNSTGANVRSDINSVLQAIASNNSGSSAPSTTYAFQLFADTTNNVMKIRNAANNAFIELFQLDGTLTLEDGSASAPALSFRTDLDTGIAKNGTNGLMITTGGVQRFSVSSTEVNVNDTGAAIDFRVESDSNSAMLLVDGSANRVGIGAATPAATLDVAGDMIFTAANPQIQFNAGGPIIKLPAANTLTFLNSSTNEVFRIHSGGEILVNNTSTFDSVSSAKVQINGEGVAGLAITGNGTSAQSRVSFFNPNGRVGFIATENSATTYSTSGSDRTLKKNFENWTENTLDLFKNINPQKFNFIHEDDGATKSKGFIAQDMVSSFPEAYVKEDIEDAKYYFNPSGMVIYLMKAIQELQAKVEALEAA